MIPIHNLNGVGIIPSNQLPNPGRTITVCPHMYRKFHLRVSFPVHSKKDPRLLLQFGAALLERPVQRLPLSVPASLPQVLLVVTQCRWFLPCYSSLVSLGVGVCRKHYPTSSSLSLTTFACTPSIRNAQSLLVIRSSSTDFFTDARIQSAAGIRASVPIR